MTSEITIRHSGGTYSVLVGSDILRDLGREVETRLAPKRVVIVTDETVEKLYLERAEKTFQNVAGSSLVVAAGEKSKSWRTLRRLSTGLLQAGVTRDDVVVALGGGVVGDLTGMAASMVKRGINLVHVPTTLVAQVDSSIGGKTGINTRYGKNTLGTFYQPKLVVTDIDVLESLPNREFWSGFAEVVKHTILAGETALRALEEYAPEFFGREPAALEEIIARSIRIKGDIVGRDETDTDERMLLNLGHTFAHAIEAAAGYDRIRHGEAVSIGICMALRFADSKATPRIEKLLQRISLPTTVKAAKLNISRRRLKRFILQDKKRAGDTIRLVVPHAPGFVKVEDVDPETLDRFLKSVTF